MRTAINLASIREGALLLVLKGNVWILPGGKPLENEDATTCLTREVGEELPKATMIIGDHFGDFTGRTPHTGDTLSATVFLGLIDGDITPAAEINDAQYFTRDQLRSLPVSEITRDIIISLAEACLF